MQEGDTDRREKHALSRKACLLLFFVAMLVASLPAATLYNLKSDLRNLARVLDDVSSYAATEIYATDLPARAFAAGVEPEARLGERYIGETGKPSKRAAVDIATTTVRLDAPQFVHDFVPASVHLLARQTIRLYDPVGPPRLSL